MIKQLRKKFIRIAMLSVSLVMLFLSLIVNIVNFISTDSDLTEMLDLICENQGSIPLHKDFINDNTDKPHIPDDTVFPPNQKNDDGRKPFYAEAPYSTRYFYLRFDESGSPVSSDLGHIAAITDDDINEYISVALKKGSGYGYYKNYKFRVICHDENRYMAVFLDCYKELRAVRIVALCSVIAIAVCLILVYALVVFFSGRAIDPVVRSAQKQKQFITDASHELKTPITVIATSLKVLEMETGKQKWIDKAMAQTEKLKNLVNYLVKLSRMDEEDSPLKLENFCISDAVSETVESFADFAGSSDHELNISITPDVNYHGDEYAIRQLISILLDNAVKYASCGCPISISLEKEKKGITIRTSNKCDGIEQAELDKLFDRFYRADKSRTTDGFGIGLSIAHSIAKGHNGSIKAVCPSDNVIEFVVKLR